MGLFNRKKRVKTQIIIICGDCGATGLRDFSWLRGKSGVRCTECGHIDWL